MQRRDFIKSMAGAGAVAAIGRRGHAAVKGWREFEITYRINVKDSATAVRLWVPVPQDALDYQRVVDLSWRSPVCYSRPVGDNFAGTDRLGGLDGAEHGTRDRGHRPGLRLATVRAFTPTPRTRNWSNTLSRPRAPRTRASCWRRRARSSAAAPRRETRPWRSMTG